jgi:hypothetical protein
MHSMECEPTIPAIKRPHIYALDHTATGIYQLIDINKILPILNVITVFL